MTVELRLEEAEKDSVCNVAKESLIALEDLLNNASVIENQNQIIERFEKEHSFYITLITVLAILLTVFGIVPVVYGFFEKSEIQETYKELEVLMFGSGEKSHVAPVRKSQILTNEKNQNYPSYTSFLE